MTTYCIKANVPCDLTFAKGQYSVYLDEEGYKQFCNMPESEALRWLQDNGKFKILSYDIERIDKITEYNVTSF